MGSGFKSKAQLKKFAELVKKGEISEEVFSKMINETPSVLALPERAPSDYEEETDYIPGVSNVKEAKII